MGGSVGTYKASYADATDEGILYEKKIRMQVKLYSFKRGLQRIHYTHKELVRITFVLTKENLYIFSAKLMFGELRISLRDERLFDLISFEIAQRHVRSSTTLKLKVDDILSDGSRGIVSLKCETSDITFLTNQFVDAVQVIAPTTKIPDVLLGSFLDREQNVFDDRAIHT